MRFAKILAWLGLLAMTAVLVNGFVNGDFNQDGGALLSNPWGVVSIVDLYVGFVLFSLWIGFRERNVFLSVLWILLMMILGFFTGSLYVLLALYRSKGDWLNFFLGARKDSVINNRM